MTKCIHAVCVAGALALAGSADAGAQANGSSELLLQMHYGRRFADSSLALSTRDGSLATLVLDWWQPVALGDHAITIRLFHGGFDDRGGQPADQQLRAYAEWNGRLRVARFRDASGARTTEVSVATEIQRASMWRGSEYVGGAVTHRHPRGFVRVTGFYQLPITATDDGYRLRVGGAHRFSIGGARFSLDGVENVQTSNWRSVSVFGIPSVMLDISDYVGRRRGAWWLGVEVMHRKSAERSELAAPQLVLRYLP